MACVITAIALLLALTVRVAQAQAQDAPTDVTFHNTSLRSTISLIANSLRKSVVFDKEVSTQRTITFERRNVLKSEALAALLQQERLYTIELGSVLIVAPDSDESSANYTPQRIAASRIGGDEDRRHDIVTPPTRLQQVLEILAKAMNREATVDALIMQESREYSFELRSVTSAEALQVVCLVAHLAVRDEGSVLAFTGERSR